MEAAPTPRDPLWREDPRPHVRKRVNEVLDSRASFWNAALNTHRELPGMYPGEPARWGARHETRRSETRDQAAARVTGRRVAKSEGTQSTAERGRRHERNPAVQITSNTAQAPQYTKSPQKSVFSYVDNTAVQIANGTAQTPQHTKFLQEDFFQHNSFRSCLVETKHTTPCPGANEKAIPSPKGDHVETKNMVPWPNKNAEAVGFIQEEVAKGSSSQDDLPSWPFGGDCPYSKDTSLKEDEEGEDPVSTSGKEDAEPYYLNENTVSYCLDDVANSPSLEEDGTFFEPYIEVETPEPCPYHGRNGCYCYEQVPLATSEENPLYSSPRTMSLIPLLRLKPSTSQTWRLWKFRQGRRI
ncbi:Fc.00g087680.m01.CDS01 [Cosmosporella sp. VM-42]